MPLQVASPSSSSTHGVGVKLLAQHLAELGDYCGVVGVTDLVPRFPFVTILHSAADTDMTDTVAHLSSTPTFGPLA
jgi:hypothetical protein